MLCLGDQTPSHLQCLTVGKKVINVGSAGCSSQSRAGTEPSAPHSGETTLPGLSRKKACGRRLDLALLLSPYVLLVALFLFTMWALLHTLNDKVPKYCDQIPHPGLTAFPKPVNALKYTFSVSDPSSYEGYIKDLKKFLNYAL